MRRRDRTGGKVKARRHKALTLKAMRRRSSSPAGRETNVARLSRELSEAFEQQAATAEILNVISNSPTDTQPVFDAIVQSGLKLFPGALVSVALRYGDTINAAAVAAPDPARVEAWRRTISRTPLARNYMHGAALLDRRIVDIPDVADAPAEFAAGGQNFLTSGNRAITIMPMMRGDEAIGLLSVVRLVAGPLSDKQLAVLRTFANQAVIAIENTRLLNELRTRSARSSRPRPPTCSRSSAARPSISRRCSTRSCESAARLCEAIMSRRSPSRRRCAAPVASCGRDRHACAAKAIIQSVGQFPRVIAAASHWASRNEARRRLTRSPCWRSRRGSRERRSSDGGVRAALGAPM